ncbi:MAG: hypothetical protein H6719_28180 [Sandaracinaceae bacterium]|nr:hypothetical protein [Sandaracinaceae bacterium]
MNNLSKLGPLFFLTAALWCLAGTAFAHTDPGIDRGETAEGSAASEPAAEGGSAIAGPSGTSLTWWWWWVPTMQ